MSLKILCSGYLIRLPTGGHFWHHFQYLLGLYRLGHTVFFLEDYGWGQSCYDPNTDQMTSDPTAGIARLTEMLEAFNLECEWIYLAEDGSTHGMSREHLANICSECDIYLGLSNMNWIPELQQSRLRVLVDTDPVFTQINAHGISSAIPNYHRYFTYGENVHTNNCLMPTCGIEWAATRQPIVLDCWNFSVGNPEAPFTSVINWSAYGGSVYHGQVFGQKDMQFGPFFDFPKETGFRLELAVSAEDPIKEKLRRGQWNVINPLDITRTPFHYSHYIRKSAGEFCVAKHAYVSTRCGWFSDRSAAYLASGRPVVLEDTGFSSFLPVGKGLMSFKTRSDAQNCLTRILGDYKYHCEAAREIAEEHFDSKKVLTRLLERCF